MRTLLLVCSGALLAIALRTEATPAVQQADPSVAARAFEVLQKRCSSCHGDTGSARTYMLLDHAAMIKTGKVVPGKPEESPLFQRITGSIEPVMPAAGPKLADSDIALIKQWIADGAPEWSTVPTPARQFITNDDVVSAIERDLNSFHGDTSRRFLRYFVLTNLYNSGDTKVATYRGALFKLLNSLSWDKDIIRPAIIDKEETIFRIDLRDYGWTDPTWTWETVLAGYPYGVELSGSAYSRIQILTSTKIPMIRADWFLAAASVPPLYHEILELPTNEGDLESCGSNTRHCLHIDTERNLRDSPGVRVVRAGFTESGVSNSNRIVERHRSPFGAYWKSYDFSDNIGEHNIFQHPLDFRRAGGEIIFNLPNGLQAYLLVNDRGQRIDQAPTNIVFDKGGSRAEIRNGLSCMSCHVNGMRSFTDDIRATLPALSPYEQDYAGALYAENDAMKKFVLEDQERFLAAVQRTGVKPGAEPIAELSERYARSVDSATAAYELGLTKDQFLKAARVNPVLHQLGLATLVSGGTVKRDAWEDVFGEVVEDLGLGSYVPPDKTYGERFFSGSPLRPFFVRDRNIVSPILVGRSLSDLIPSITSGFIGRTVRSIENGRERIYAVREVRISQDCSAEIVDSDRFNDLADPRQSWSEEYTQRFSLRTVQASMTSNGDISRIVVTGLSPGVIRLERSSFNQNQWNDPSIPPAGRRTEFPAFVQFDLPRESETDRAFTALRNAIEHCSTSISRD
jgi:mono/diheme cytochrome c family protein